ncbi:MAG: hypothetical protein ACM3X9_04370 [Bacillota bacterium]
MLFSRLTRVWDQAQPVRLPGNIGPVNIQILPPPEKTIKIKLFTAAFSDQIIVAAKNRV